MNKHSEELTNYPHLKAYIHLKKQSYYYFLSTGESSRILSAFEELDDLIDFLDMQIELNYGQNQAYGRTLIDNRNIVHNLFKNASGQLRSFLDNKKLLDPTIADFIDKTKAYLLFKEAANKYLPSERHDHIRDLASSFERSFSQIRKLNLEDLYDGAVEDLRDFPSEWIKKITFCNRNLLENMGIQRVQPEKRHLLFNNMSDQSREQPKEKRAARSNKKSRSPSIQRPTKTLLRFLRPKRDTLSAAIPSDIYLTKNLDRYLYVRDLWMNLVRKWARFIPLNMNHLLIKIYNEPHYWNDKHVFPANEDHLRLGIAYFQYAMELGKGSEYTTMIYRKALACFQRGKIRLPMEMKEKLWGFR